MTAVRGGPAGPDGLGGSFQNEAETDRSAWWLALTGKQGVLKGFTLAGVGGLMALDVAAGSAVVSELDGSGNVQQRGYLVWADSTTRVTFGAASASARNDALVAAFVDTEDGAVGTGALAVGAHLVVIPGVSGTSTVRTDAQIRAWLGRGGYIRLADVPIASSDTQINTANIVASAESIPMIDSGSVTNAFTAATGWSITSQTLRRIRGIVYFIVYFTRTGAAITVDSHGDMGNSPIATWDLAKYPILMQSLCSSAGTGPVGAGLCDTTGTLYLAAVGHPSVNIATSDTRSLAGYWPSY